MDRKGTTEEMRRIKESIDVLRQKLYGLIGSDLRESQASEEEIVALSRKLDELIVAYHREQLRR